MRIIFAGSPQFAVPTLEKLAASSHELAAVITQPDRPQGRAQKSHGSPVKEAAVRLGLPIQQPEKIKSPEAVALLKSLAADAMVVVGYGQILSQAILDLPRFGCINLHGSLLPAYRGAAPIQWAIVNGETKTGVTTMLMDAGLDTGAILLEWETGIGPGETAVELGERMSGPGADLVLETLRRLEEGSITPVPQDDAKATRAPILKKEDGRIDWTKSGAGIFNQIRGLLPWPGAYTFFRGNKLQIWKARLAERPSEPSPVGTLVASRYEVIVSCGDGAALQLLEVQQEGKKRLTALEFSNGARLQTPERFSLEQEKG